VKKRDVLRGPIKASVQRKTGELYFKKKRGGVERRNNRKYRRLTRRHTYGRAGRIVLGGKFPGRARKSYRRIILKDWQHNALDGAQSARKAGQGWPS